MNEKFKHLILNEWRGSNDSLTESLKSLRGIVLSCYDLGKENYNPTNIHFKDESTGTQTSLSIADGIPGIRFEFNQSTSAFFNTLFKSINFTYDDLSELNGNDISILLDMFSDDYNVRKQNLMFANFASVGGFFLTVYLDPINKNVVDLVAYLLSQHSSTSMK
jgi:hypothetical protein